MNRKKIELTSGVIETLQIMSEGNIGAARILMDLLKKDDIIGPMYMLHLDDMNIRGEQIWLGYKDVCKEDLDVFISKIINRDAAMVRYINEYPYKGTTEIATTNGASKRW